jgi:hypothetical protein
MRKLLILAAAAAVSACHSSTPESARSAEAAKQEGDGLLSVVKTEPITIAEGTTLRLVMQTTISSASVRTGDVVVAKLANGVVVSEKTVLPEGTEVRGQVTAATPSGCVKGRARLALEFDHLVYKGKPAPIEARAIDITADSTHKRDAAIIAGGTTGGAVIGAVAGSPKGALIGGLISAAPASC